MASANRPHDRLTCSGVVTIRHLPVACFDALGRIAFRRCVPNRWKLPLEVAILKRRGRLEEELFLLNKLVTRTSCAIDVGANRGYYSYFMAKQFAQVFAFEPIPDFADRLAAWNPGNILIHHCALSSRHCEAHMYIPFSGRRELHGLTSLHPDNASDCDHLRRVTVECRPLDDFGIENVSLIKIDVEGHEVHVLDGAANTIQKSRPTLIVEVKKHNRGAVAEYFAALDYAVFQLLESGMGLSRLWKAGVLDDIENENFVFLPKEAASEILARFESCVQGARSYRGETRFE